MYNLPESRSERNAYIEKLLQGFNFAWREIEVRYYLSSSMLIIVALQWKTTTPSFAGWPSIGLLLQTRCVWVCVYNSGAAALEVYPDTWSGRMDLYWGIYVYGHADIDMVDIRIHPERQIFREFAVPDSRLQREVDVLRQRNHQKTQTHGRSPDGTFQWWRGRVWSRGWSRGFRTCRRWEPWGKPE